MERRVLETVYPVSVQKSSGIWSMFLDKLGLAREVDEKPKGFELDSLSFPWHLLKLGEMDILIINRSFETSWIMDMTTGEIKEVLRGGAVLEVYEHLIIDKVSLLNDIHGTWSQQIIDHSFPLGRIIYASLISSVAKLDNKTVVCDSAAQRILEFYPNSKSKSYIQFSNLKVLGLPYWFICPLERVFNRGYLDKPRHELLHHSDVQPGRCQIQVTVHIPKDTELAAPLEEACIWRQARGTAAEVYGLEKEVKAGVAQKFYDQLDNLVLENSEIESDLQDEEISLDRSLWYKDKVHFNCTVDLSPGTCELVVSAVLYLQLKNEKDIREEQAIKVRRILGLEKPDSRDLENDACVDLLSKTCGDTRDIVFMKPLHLRMRFDCADHPPALTSKETIIDDTIKEINVSLG